MLCSDIEFCINEIASYYSGDVSGYPFILNIDDSFEYHTFLSKIKADSSKKIIRVSDYCTDDNLPDVNAAVNAAASSDNVVLYGISSYYMLQGENALKREVTKLSQLAVTGHVVILFSGCSKILKSMINNDLRLNHRIVIFESEQMIHPKIYVTDNEKNAVSSDLCMNFKSLLIKLEEQNWSVDQKFPEITVVTKFKASVFKNAVCAVESCGGIYEVLCEKFPEIKSGTEKLWGKDEQWEDLYLNLQKYKSLSSVMDNIIGSTVNLSSYIEEKFEDINGLDAWYLWLAMKVFGTKENHYLTITVKESNSPANLVDKIYFELLLHKNSDEGFMSLYKERKRLIEKLPESLDMIKRYCDHVGQFERAAVYYLTDYSEREKLRFLKALSSYEYTYDEVMSITKELFPSIHQYLEKFTFNKFNTIVPSNDESMHSMLTDYFNEYKLQKVINQIHPEFISKVNENAISRPYNKLLPRISIVKDIDKTNAQIHFFDALGVEYLSYISTKCEQLGLQCHIHVGHSEIPSITKTNTEFRKFFKTVKDSDGNDILPGTKELDELKHHSKEVDYTKCKEPIHLFMELEIIDKELSKIKGMLDGHEFEKIIIISDHGASRLAVLNQSESELFQIENHSEHSGRCCETSKDPEIAEATYENGYAVLANYDRFKGSRKANVEVHGGATLEETVVPIIEITKKSEETEVYIVNSFVEFHNKELVSVIIYCDLKLSSPKLMIKKFNDTIYECSDYIDDKHYKFDIPDIKRSLKITVDLYNGNNLIKKDMLFEVKKALSTTKDFF